MKPIEVTFEQREKLIKMLKTLFPEYERYGWSDSEDSELIFLHKTGEKPVLFHWYEVCMTFLCRKIGNSEAKTLTTINYDESTLRGEMIFQQEWSSNYHPIDFLYEYFLNLE